SARHPDPGHQRRRGDEGHADGRQLPGVASYLRHALRHRSLLVSKSAIGLMRTGRGDAPAMPDSNRRISGELEGRARAVSSWLSTPRRWPSEPRRLGLREADAKVAGADGADDRVAIARRLHLDPRAAEVGRPVRVVGGDL